jgi:hypothetical protein
MIQKIVEINPHKALGIFINDSPFSCVIQQFFVDSMDDFKTNLVNENNSSVMIGLNYNEFLTVSQQIAEYMMTLKNTSHLVEALSVEKVE